MEASGWPKGADTDEKKTTFLAQFLKREGIQLEAENVKKNPGLRPVPKLALNSFWGKFGQRSNMMNGAFFTDPSKLLELLMDETNILHSILPFGATPEETEMVYVSTTKEEEFVDILPNTNVVVAAFTTSTARLKLYSYLEKLQDRALYFDTGKHPFTFEFSSVFSIDPLKNFEKLYCTILGFQTRSSI